MFFTFLLDLFLKLRKVVEMRFKFSFLLEFIVREMHIKKCTELKTLTNQYLEWNS